MFSSDIAFTRVAGLQLLRLFLVMAVLLGTIVGPAEAKPQFSALALDARTGKILFSKDIDGLRHPASLTKVMTLYLLFQDLKAQRINLGTNLSVSKRASGMAPSKLGLKPGATISVDNAIKALVTRSANDVAATIAENLGGSEANFAARMTRTARAIGMPRSTFMNASGLPNSDQWTTARDMATLSLRIQRDFPQYYPYFRIASFVYNGKTIRTHNKLLGNYQGTDGIKTGYIAASGFNLTTSVKRGDKRVVGVVLGAPSTGSRNRYMMTMLDGVFPSCVNGKTIAAKAGTSDGAIDPISTTAQADALKPKRRSIFNGKVDDGVKVDETAVAQIEEQSQHNAGSTFKTVIAEDQTSSAHETKVLEAKMLEASATPDDSGEEPDMADSGDTVALPSHLPFEVKKSSGATGGQIVVASIDPSWNIQIGAFPKKEEARQKLLAIKTSGFHFLSGKPALTVEVQKGKETIYRARFSGFNRKTAKAACTELSKKGMTCETVSPQT